MHNAPSGISSLIKRNVWWTTLIILIIVGLFFFIVSSKKVTLLDAVIVERQNIREEVSTTGNVKPLSDLDLSFETGGQVSKVYVSVGDKVYEGQLLATLSNADLVAAVEQAKAGLKITQANLASIKKGTRPEELIISKGSLDDAKISLENKIVDSYTKADDAVRNDVDQMFDNPRTSLAKISLVLNNSQLESDINAGRYEIESILNDWNSNSSVLSASTAYLYLDKIKSFLDNVALGVNAITVSSNLTQTTIDKYKAALSSARTSIGLAYSNLNTAETAYNLAKSNYELKVSGNTAEVISAQEASVEQAQANVDAAQARLAKSKIASPISGVITNVNAKVGQTIQPSVTAISVISYGKYNIESYVPEADIAKVKIGNLASTTLDAYGSDTFFETSVVKIDPGETVIENVPTYKITLIFASSSDSRIKSGMTANLDILTNERNNVLAVPSRSVYTIDNEKYVKLVDFEDSSKSIETKVKTGIRGTNGYIEILSGLKEGDNIVASPNI